MTHTEQAVARIFHRLQILVMKLEQVLCKHDYVYKSKSHGIDWSLSVKEQQRVQAFFNHFMELW